MTPTDQEHQPLLSPPSPPSSPSPPNSPRPRYSTLSNPKKQSPQPPSSPVSSASGSILPAIAEESLLGSSEQQQQPSRSIEDDVLPETSPLGRTLSWSSAYILVISRVIGSGIFATPGAIARDAGSPGLSLLLWVSGACVAACALAISLEYGCMLPRSGGDKVYLEFVYRRPRFLASTFVAVQAVLLGFTASNCVVFSEYVLFALGFGGDGGASEFLRKAVAVGLLAFVTVVHGVWPRAGVRLQNVLGWVKVGLVGFMVLSGLYVLVFRPSPSSDYSSSLGLLRSRLGEPSHDSSSRDGGGRGGPARALLSWDSLWAGSNWNWGIISTSLFKVFYSFAGLENANNVLNEVKDPVRTLKSVTRTALVTACAMYLLVNVAYFTVVPLDEIKASGELIAALFFERAFGDQLGRVLLPFAVALSAAGNVLVVAFAMSRLKQEIARQGFLPFTSLLSSTRPFGSPLGGLVVHFIPSFLVIVLPPSKQVYSFILEVEGYPGQFFALASASGLLWLRYKRPDLKRPFKAWIPAVLLRIALCLPLIAAPFFPPKEKPANGLFYATYAIVGASIMSFSILYWYVWTVLLPKWRGYRLEEQADVLDDGTTITKLVHVPR